MRGLKEQYIKNQILVELVTARAVDKLYLQIEDENTEMSTAQVLDLCEALIARCCNGGYKSINEQ